MCVHRVIWIHTSKCENHSLAKPQTCELYPPPHASSLDIGVAKAVEVLISSCFGAEAGTSVTCCPSSSARDYWCTAKAKTPCCPARYQNNVDRFICGTVAWLLSCKRNSIEKESTSFNIRAANVSLLNKLSTPFFPATDLRQTIDDEFEGLLTRYRLSSCLFSWVSPLLLSLSPFWLIRFFDWLDKSNRGGYRCDHSMALGPILENT